EPDAVGPNPKRVKSGRDDEADAGFVLVGNDERRLLDHRSQVQVLDYRSDVGVTFLVAQDRLHLPGLPRRHLQVADRILAGLLDVAECRDDVSQQLAAALWLATRIAKFVGRFADAQPARKPEVL